jgi:hypothetical protein
MRGFQFKDIKEVEEQVVLRPTLVEVPVPDAEVCEPKKRRVLSASWKLNFLRKFEACKDEAERGKLLRSESVYLSQVYAWKKEVKEGKLTSKSKGHRGPAPKRNREFDQLQRENERLKKKLLQAEQIIALQKKVAALFGETDESES